jgi:Cu(I)/Ag(I) efflux system membrane fusion protein
VEVPDRDRPTYEARTVRLGPRIGASYPVVAGLTEGERVVTRGAFVLDADLQIRGGDSMMRAPDDTQPAVDMLQVPPAQLHALEPVMTAYLKAQEALARDELSAARDSARTLAAAARTVHIEAAEPVRAAWVELAEALVTHAQSLADAPTLEQARGEFEQLSDLSQRLLAQFGNPLGAPVWVAYCPMALGSEGASWVQRSETIHNSYFGAQMEDCGELRESVPAGSHMMSDPTTAGGTP